MATTDFRGTLIEIDNNLDTDDVSRFKFLCKDDLPHKQLDKATCAIDVFSILEQKGKLKAENTNFIQECFHYMQRKDLIRKLGGDPEGLERNIQRNGPRILLPFRAMMFEIAEDVGSSDLEKMKFYARNSLQLKKKQMENISTCFDLFNVLEREEYVSPADINFLEKMLQANGDEEVLEILNQYKSVNTVNQHQNNTASQHAVSGSGVNAINRTQQILNTPNTRTYVQPLSPDQELSSLTSTHPPQRDAADSMITHMAAQQVCHPQQPELPSYKMTAKPPGLCLILNNKNFTDGQKSREGSDIDAGNLKQIFGQKLQFRISVVDDLKGQEIITTCRAVANLDHTSYDAFVMCVLSHGSIGAIHGIDGQPVSIKQITSCFSSSACPTLAGKPKLFFFQACQGMDKQKGHSHSTTVVPPDPLEMDVTVDQLSDANKMIPDEADYLLGFATVPGYVSYRSRSTGSFYVNKLVEMLNKYAFSVDLLSILIRVNDAVSNLDANMENVVYKQVPAPQFTLTKSVIFRR